MPAEIGHPERLTGRRVVLIVTGGIAAYKSCQLVRDLRRWGAEVQTILTNAATEFITPLTFATLSGRPALVNMFPPDPPVEPIHLQLAEWGELLVVAPASADFIAKMAHGLAGDLAGAVAAAWDGPVLLAPAMNPRMWRGAALQENISVLKHRGVEIVGPEEGAMGGVSEPAGLGRMSEPAVIRDAAEMCLADRTRWRGRKVMVSSGPTREALDPVRFISNRSSGLMGDAVARRAALRGAEVTLIRGRGAAGSPPAGVKVVEVESAAEMAQAVKEGFSNCHLLVMAAAVSDWTPAKSAASKLKRRDGAPEILWVETEDILGWACRQRSEGQIVAGFALETERHIEEARLKLENKRADLIALNDPTANHSLFGGDTIQLTLLTPQAPPIHLPVLPKWMAADRLLDVLNPQLT